MNALLLAAALALGAGNVAESAAAGPAPAAIAADPADVLREADRAFCRETRERGLEGWLAWFADDAALLPPEGPLVEGRDEVRAHFAAQKGFPQPGFTWEPIDAGISAAGDFGWTSGRAGNDAPGTAQWGEGRYMTVWKRTSGGEWRVVTDIGGEPGFARKLPGLDGAPATLGRESERSFSSAAGDLVAQLGAWWASDAGGAEVGGRFLSVWRRNADGTHELVFENGFAQRKR